MGPIEEFTTKKALIKAMDEVAVQDILDEKARHSTMRAASQPLVWFKLQKHVNDSRASKYLCQIRAGASGLGNRFMNAYGKKYTDCPACLQIGMQEELWEGHVVFRCPLVKRLRRQVGVVGYAKEAAKRGVVGEHMLLRKYLGDDGSCPAELLDRGVKAQKLISKWMADLH